MAHHSSEPDPKMGEIMRQIADKHPPERFDDLVVGQPQRQTPRLGATGKFPLGQLTPNDEGEIQIAIGVLPASKEKAQPATIVIDFGKSITWLGLTPEQARGLGETLIERARIAEGG